MISKPEHAPTQVIKKQRKHPVRYFIGQVHLWLGLASGLVVLIVSLTGAIYTFQDEIRDFTEPWRFVKHKSGFAYLPPSQLQRTALSKHPYAKVNRIVYTARNRSAAVLITEKKTLLYIYMDPYSGDILKEKNLRQDFFVIVQFLHMYLLLPPAIGKYIVGISTIIFVLLLISGIVIWWPKRKTDRKRSFTIKWGAKWKRVNYDLHNVLGFYMASVLFIIAVTGLSMSFEWMRKSLYISANLGKTYKSDTRPEFRLDTNQPATNKAIDKALFISAQKSPQTEMFLISPASKPGSPVSVSAYYKTLHYARSDQYYFHPQTGQLLDSRLHEAKSPGTKLNTMNYDIHTGQILGLPGKIIAFFASLISASLPVTGFIIWLGRRKKSSAKKSAMEKQKVIAALKMA